MQLHICKHAATVEDASWVELLFQITVNTV